MDYLLCTQRVADYTLWRQVFDSHAEGHQEAGLHLLHVLHDLSDPNVITVFFRIDDLERARAFTQAPAASEGADASGVIGAPELSFLSDT